MGWVVKTWRVEDELRSAERAARRIERTAARELADAAAHLDALELLGARTLEGVRRRRTAERPDPPEPAGLETVRSAPRADPILVPDPAPLTVRAVRNPRRSSLRDSPLSDLFKAAAAR